MFETMSPRYDPELAAALSAAPHLATSLTLETLSQLAPLMAELLVPIEVSVGERPIEILQLTAPGHEGAELAVTVLRPKTVRANAPAMYHVHGGGMILGDRNLISPDILDWVVEHGMVLASVEYRLAPAFPDPYPIEDVYAGLVWFAAQAEALGFDANRIMIGGTSAGGGLAAGAALLARDRNGPALIGQMLICPMLDDRNTTASTHQYTDPAPWNRQSNLTGWSALLGDRVGTDDVSIYASPARADDLTGLPPAFIDVGSAEPFRDEDVAYASAIWAVGGHAELHVYAGGFHGFDLTVPHASVSVSALAARSNWVTRILGA